MSFVKDIKNIIQDVQQDSSLVSDLRGEVKGLSGKNILGFLQKAARYQESNNMGLYVEVGVYYGLSLFSVANAAPGMQVCGIENFCLDKNAKSFVLDYIERKKLKNISIYVEDFETCMNKNEDFKTKKIALYFYDGAHDYRSQLLGLMLAKKYFCSSVVIVIDDANYNHVRQANRDFLLLNPEYKLLFEAYTGFHPAHMNAQELEEAKETYWNGINVLVHDQKNELSPAYPPIFSDREYFYNDHAVHSSKYPLAIGVATRFMDMLLEKKLRYMPLKLFKELKNLKRSVAGYPSKYRVPYLYANTCSSDLPKERFNPSLS